LDANMITLFSGQDETAPEETSNTLLSLNERAFLDERVNVIIGDAFIEVEKLISAGQHYDTIIVDLPDPSHPDLNKLYSDYFYRRLKELLSGDGAIAIQSTSPYHAKKAFICIGKTLAAAGFKTEQYHANVPTFGEWGWTLGTLRGQSASRRIDNVDNLPVHDAWLSKEQIQASFVFSPTFFRHNANIAVNRLGSHTVYHYHHQAWAEEDGVFFVHPP